MEYIDPITGRTYVPDNERWLSPDGNPGLVSRDFRFTANDIDTRTQGLWRYRKAIALPYDAHIVSFNEGMTPVCQADFFGQQVWVKQEYLFPTGSYKDRGATAMISAAKTFGIENVLEDSSGNAGCAVSAYCAAADISCEIYVPEKASPAKINQMVLYGSTVHKIAGNREDAAHSALEAAKETWFASHVYNPWFYEGTKTFAYEIWEQFGDNLPDEIMFPVGNGTLLLGTWIGFNELLRSNAIHKIPKLSLVQAENCAPLLNRMEFNITKAEGIAVRTPARKQQIIQAVRQSGGEFHSVSEEEIAAARKETALKGYFIEFTSAASVAVLLKKNVENRILFPLTGSGLKNN